MRCTFFRQAACLPVQALADGRLRVLYAVCVLIAACLCSTAAAQDSVVVVRGEGSSTPVSVSSPDASSRVVSYVFAFEQDSITLPDRNIFVGSETVRVGTRLLDRTEYFLNCESGLICLKLPAPAGSAVQVRYRFLPFYLRSSYFLRSQGTAQPTSGQGAAAHTVAAASPPVERYGLPSRGGLKLRGTKTFSLELGSNREASMKQSLDMNVSGEITKGLELNAVLTDRDLPIQPEGRTASVRELDEIRVEMRSKAFSASLGDCDLALEGASLVNVSRRLEGARATGIVKNVELTAAGSTLRGRWTSREFVGVEGKQGPYHLTTDAGAPGVVIAGSERVWLDGERLRRGEGADYWMDYSAGKLYFTNVRAIHSESRVRVEYEYSYGDFQKNFYALRAARGFGGGLARLEFLAVSEADAGPAESGNLSEEEKNILRELGDGSIDRTVDGARYVGPGNGEYDLVSVDSLGVSIYQYSADGTGSYDVSFVNVGQGKGSYLASADTTGKTFFAYVGPNSAEFVPARALTAPATKRVEDVRTVFSLKGVEVTSELALSQADLNTFSSRDDGDNLGRAGLVAVKNAPARLSVAGRSLGRFSFAGNLRQVDENFITFGNLNRAFDAERWGLSDSAAAGSGERRLEVETAYNPVERLRFSFAHGRLESSSGLSARRFVYGSELTGRLSVSARLERASSEGGSSAASSGSDAMSPAAAQSSRTIRTIATRLNGLTVVPAVSYYTEERRPAGGPGLTIVEAGAGLSSAWKAPFTVRIDEKYRVEYAATAGDRTRAYDALTHTLAVQVAKWRSLSASCEYSLRDLHGYLGAGNRRTELGRLSVSQTVQSGRFSYEVDHLVTSLDLEQSTKAIVYVGQNQGHYDSTGVYRGRGDYEVSITKLDSSVLSSDAATSAALTIRPFKGIEKRPRREQGLEHGRPGHDRLEGERSQAEGTGGAGPEGARPQAAETPSSVAGTLETLTLTSLLRSSGTFRDDEGIFAMLASPMYTQRESGLRGSSLLRQEVEVASPSRRLALRYLFELSGLLNNQYENVRENNEEKKNGVRLRTEPSRFLTLELEQTWKTRSRQVEVYQGATERGMLTGSESTLDVRLLPVRNVELELRGSFSGLRDGDAGNRLSVYRVSPSATYGVQTSTRARLMCTISSYEGETAVLSTAAPVALIQPYRIELFFSLDHRAGEHLTFSTSVGSRKSTGDFVTDGRVEMRAYF